MTTTANASQTKARLGFLGLDGGYDVEHHAAYASVLGALAELKGRLPLLSGLNDYRLLFDDVVDRHVRAGWSRFHPAPTPLDHCSRSELFQRARRDLAALRPHLGAFDAGLLLGSLDAAWAKDEATAGLGDAVEILWVATADPELRGRLE